MTTEPGELNIHTTTCVRFRYGHLNETAMLAGPAQAGEAALANTEIGKQPYVRFDRKDYSIPHDRVRRAVTVLASTEQVRVIDGTELIATHPRSFDKGQQIEDPKHLEALVALKKEARKERTMDRLHHDFPNGYGSSASRVGSGSVVEHCR